MSEDKKSGIDELSINTIRVVAADMVQKANSGHPGMPMGMAPVAHVLWQQFLKISPSHPKWANRDRFILSNGHGCALQYVLLHLAGFKLTLDDLKAFRQLGSKTPGHPERTITEGIEVTTGPLGQGFANGVGIAMAQHHMAGVFNKENFPLFDNYTYVFCGDGCLQEGITSEAASLAGHLGLSKLIVIYDDNHVTIDGDTELSFSENVPKRFEAYGWHTITVKNGDSDLKEIAAAIAEAREIKDKPTIISLKTTIGFGSKHQGTEAVHGSPLGAEEVKNVKKKFGFDPDKTFVIDDAVYQQYAHLKKKGEEHAEKWNKLLEGYAAKYPELAKELNRRLEGKLPPDWHKLLPKWESKSADATRNMSYHVLNALAPTLTELVGGSADLTPSTKTQLKCTKDFQKNSREGRYFRFGVREHAMVAIGNGLSAYGGLIPFTATFLNFIEYAFPAVRLAAISEHQHILVMTHDSIGLGEDGPTHQPIEALSLCRATPNVLTIRPADENETSGAYVVAIEHRHGPTVLALSRQNVPKIPNTAVDKVRLGGYVVVQPEAKDDAKLDLILVASGSELWIAIEAAKKLENLRVRVVSMPSTDLFSQQSAAYRRDVLTPGVPVISIEALAIQGWEKYAHYCIGMKTFGASGPDKAVYDAFGLTPEKVALSAKNYLEKIRLQAKDLNLPIVYPLHTHFDLTSSKQ